jgi:hypothetical protein
MLLVNGVHTLADVVIANFAWVDLVSYFSWGCCDNHGYGKRRFLS